MNYLAHIYLARQSDKAMIGALLGDFVRADVTGKFGSEIEREILIHRKVDIFTDNHDVVRAARAYFGEGRRRYAGILLDVFYDHVLTANWSDYCDQPLHDFMQQFYRGLQQNLALLPPNLAEIAPRMIGQDWLGSYQDYAGVEVAITRIASRLSRNGHLLCEGLQDLRTHYDVLCTGFNEFFPQLMQFVEEQRKLLGNGGSS